MPDPAHRAGACVDAYLIQLCCGSPHLHQRPMGALAIRLRPNNNLAFSRVVKKKHTKLNNQGKHDRLSPPRSDIRLLWFQKNRNIQIKQIYQIKANPVIRIRIRPKVL